MFDETASAYGGVVVSFNLRFMLQIRKGVESALRTLFKCWSVMTIRCEGNP